jgi:hypothetical protein
VDARIELYWALPPFRSSTCVFAPSFGAWPAVGNFEVQADCGPAGTRQVTGIHRNFLLLFFANAAAFILFGWALESWEGEPVDWDLVAEAAVFGGATVAGLSLRLGASGDAQQKAEGGRSWIPFHITLAFWAILLCALAMSALALWLFGVI